MKHIEVNENYIPITLDELIKRIQRMMKESEGEITGEEYVTNATVVQREDHPEYPPFTIIFELRRGTMKPDRFECGSFAIYPERLHEKGM